MGCYKSIFKFYYATFFFCSFQHHQCILLLFLEEFIFSSFTFSLQYSKSMVNLLINSVMLYVQKKQNKNVFLSFLLFRSFPYQNQNRKSIKILRINVCVCFVLFYCFSNNLYLKGSPSSSSALYEN